MIWKRTHRRRLPLLRGNGPQVPDLVLVRRRRFRQVPDREVEVRQLLRGLFLGFGEPAERIVVRVDTPEPQGPTELVTIAQLENRLADSVRCLAGCTQPFPRLVLFTRTSCEHLRLSQKRMSSSGLGLQVDWYACRQGYT